MERLAHETDPGLQIGNLFPCRSLVPERVKFLVGRDGERELLTEGMIVDPGKLAEREMHVFRSNTVAGFRVQLQRGRVDRDGILPLVCCADHPVAADARTEKHGGAD